MFKNLFNKKKEVPVEVKQDWAVYFCLVDSCQASVRLNLSLNEIAPIEDYKYRTWFSVKLLDPDENGFTTREEYPKICQIEDDILDALMKKGVIMAGAVKTNGVFDLYLYSKSVEGYEEIINSVMKAHADYKYATDFKEDVSWDDYFNFLYPSEYEYQTIQNQRVLMSLEEHGNDPEKEREVDHWIYFKTAGDMENYIRKVEETGYKVLSNTKLDDDKTYPYQLNISRQDNTVWSRVNDYVWELIVLANENDGNYDGWGCPIAK
ncbi:MAG: DUF695 domain-containing protein [Tannerella sp.]|jgi:uncharacterized protein (TIGR01619 family)|nr:DUF695 domain-containing protein [Tannerella sp.]